MVAHLPFLEFAPEFTDRFTIHVLPNTVSFGWIKNSMDFNTIKKIKKRVVDTMSIQEGVRIPVVKGD